MHVSTARHMDGEAVRGEAARDALDLLATEAAVAHAQGELRLDDAADGHALAVHKRGRLEGLDGVTHRVAPVERTAQALSKARFAGLCEQQTLAWALLVRGWRPLRHTASRSSAATTSALPRTPS